MNDSRLPKPNGRWYHLTPDRFFLVLLVVQVLLLLSERFQCFAFNEKKGWTVLIAVGVVGVAVVVILVWLVVSLFRRRRFQFGFRSLLVFVVVLSVPLGWFAREMQQARRQRGAVEAIRKEGFVILVRYDYELDETGAFIPRAQPTTPVWLRKSLGDDFFRAVTTVDLSGTQVTDTGLECLRGLNNLKELYLGGNVVTDAGLEHLKGLTSLERLGLNVTQVTDAGLEHLKGLTSLESLDLDQTEVSDAGLEHLKGLTSLESLDLSSTQVSDAGLEHLKGLTRLGSLRLHFTQVSDEGVKKLQQALPNCEIEHQLSPEFAEAYHNRGLAHYHQGELDKAIEDYTEAIRINPEYANAYYNRGVAYDGKGELDNAIADYTEAIRLNPKNADAYQNRGVAYRDNGDQAKAEADFAKAEELGYEPE